MLSLYYKIWVDAIVSTRSAGSDLSQNWKMFTILPISVLQGINLLTILFWIRGLSHGGFPVFLPVRLFNVLLLDDFISVVITFFIPFILLNYLLIFSNQRYDDLLKAHQTDSVKTYRWYAIITIGIFVIPYILKFLC